MMRNLSDRELLAHIAHAVDAGEARVIEAALAVDPVARGRHRMLEQRVREHVARDAVIVPQLFLPGRSPRFSMEVAAAAMCEAGVRAGDRVILRVVPTGPPSELKPVVLHVHEGRAEVLYPQTREEWVALDVFSEAPGGGAYDVEVVPATAGEHRYVVALLDPGVVVDWAVPGEDRWKPLRDAIEDGTVPASAVRVVVE